MTWFSGVERKEYQSLPTKGGGERGSIENWLPMRGRGGKESKEWHSLRWDQLNFIVTQ